MIRNHTSTIPNDSSSKIPVFSSFYINNFSLAPNDSPLRYSTNLSRNSMNIFDGSFKIFLMLNISIIKSLYCEYSFFLVLL